MATESTNVTPAPDDFQATKLDALEAAKLFQEAEDATGGSISETQYDEPGEDLLAAARAAGIKLEGDKEPAKEEVKEEAKDETLSEEADVTADTTEEALKEATTEASKTEVKSEPAKVEAAKTETAKVEPAKTEPAKTEVSERDQDLTPNLNPNTHPKTKKVIEDFKAKVIESRNERDNLKKEIEALKASGAGAIPETAKKEIEELRTKIREVDILRDPTLRAKYDDKIVSNTDAAFKILLDEGIGLDKDGKPLAKDVVDNIRKNLNLKTAAPYIKFLEEAGELEKADEIKDYLRSNTRLAKEKDLEIKDWQTNFETRKKQETEAQEKQWADHCRKVEKETDEEIFKAVTDHPTLKRPAAPLPNDAPAIKKAKEAAIAEWEKEATVYKQSIQGIAQDTGKAFKEAAVGNLFRYHLTPKLQKELASSQARIAQLEAELGKVRKAGSMKPVATDKVSQTKQVQKVDNEGEFGPTDAIIAAARSLGIDTST